MKLTVFCLSDGEAGHSGGLCRYSSIKSNTSRTSRTSEISEISAASLMLCSADPAEVRTAVGCCFLLIFLIPGHSRHTKVLASSEAQQLHVGLDWSVYIVCNDCIFVSSSSNSLHLAISKKLHNAMKALESFFDANKLFLSVKYFHDSRERKFILFVVFYFTLEKKRNYK